MIRGAVVQRVADPEAVARAAAEEFASAAEQAVAARGRFTVALSGGTSPQRLHALLADPAAPFRARVAWDRTHVFFGDERPVPPDHPESNYGAARATLLAHVPVASVHRMRGEDPGAAESYEDELRSFFGVPPGGEPPRLDLVLLGLGPDGHTASLFPGNAALEERVRWVISPFVERLGTRRVTLTYPVLDRARAVLFEVNGAQKAEVVARVLAPAPGTPPLPAARVAPKDGRLAWILDREAASALDAGPGRAR
jgi:6-phosphogluconolactonase